MQAIDRFDSAKGVRLSTYAKWWIRAAMQEYIMRSWSLVRIGTTVGQRKLFFNLRRIKNELTGATDSQLSPQDIETIMERLNVAQHEVLSMDGRLAHTDASLNQVVSQEDDAEWQDRLVEESADQEAVLEDRQEFDARRAMIDEALNELPERERQIFIVRRLKEEKPTLGELGKIFDLSPERVRQIEHSVMAKVQEFVQHRIGSDNSIAF